MAYKLRDAFDAFNNSGKRNKLGNSGGAFTGEGGGVEHWVVVVFCLGSLFFFQSMF